MFDRQAHRRRSARVAGIPWGNGELRSAAANPSFQILFGTDKNLRYQQNLAERKIAIVVLGQGRRQAINLHAATVISASNCCLAWKLQGR
jgi:hypothetical protein